MAAQLPSSMDIDQDAAQDADRSEDEDSTVEFDQRYFPDVGDPAVMMDEDDPWLTLDDWEPRDALNWEFYVPTWTRPGYDDNTEVTGDGKRQRPRRGDPWQKMRPAILPTDPPASQYARRFGIYPDGPLNEKSEARSLLTPVPNSLAGLGFGDSDIEWSVEESFQALNFGKFTTKELSDSGAFDPNQTVLRPDLQGDIFHLMARDRWTQEPTGIREDDIKENVRFDLWYNLNGEKKPWDVQKNDELWAALQPALRLASKVLLSDHPFWKAILSIYHLRPVPEERDGRTQQQKEDPRHRPLVSVWYDVDEDKMYPQAKVLMDKKFDSAAATLEALRRLLKFSIFRSDQASSASTELGIVSDPQQRSIRIEIQAANIWPLLVPQYSESEKISVSLYLAKTILHELAHACRLAHIHVLFFPDVLDNPAWTPPPGTKFDDDIRRDLKGLGFDILQIPPRMQFLFQDIPQMEEGKSFDQQIWGSDLHVGPEAAVNRHNDSYRPVISAVGWPWKHPMVHLQNQRSVDAGLYAPHAAGGYNTYLLDPPVTAYDLVTPLPVKSFAKFMQESWWDGDFVKFGHQALKIPIHSTEPSSPLKTVARPDEWLYDFYPFLTSVIRSRIALIFIDRYALPQLEKHNQRSLKRYLSLLTREAVSASIFRNRLHYEKRTWPNRVRVIQDLGNTSTQSFDTVWENLTQALQRPLSDKTANDVGQITTKIRELLVHLMELNRLLGVEIQYSQALAAQYILKTAKERKKIHRRYMQHLQQNLVQMSTAVVEVLERVAPSNEPDVEVVWESITAHWEAPFMFMVESSPTVIDKASEQQKSSALSEAMKQQTNTAIAGLADMRKLAQQTCTDLRLTAEHMDDLLSLLSEQFIDFPIAAAPAELFPGIPVAHVMMQHSRIVEKAAIYEIIRLKNRPIDDIIRQWMRILQAHTGLSERVRGIRDTVTLGRAKVDLEAILTILFHVKRGQVQLAGPVHEDGRHPRDLALLEIRDIVTARIRAYDNLREWLRDFCLGEGDEEEFEIIMHMASQRTPSQGQYPQGQPPQQRPSQQRSSRGQSSQAPPSQGQTSQGHPSQKRT